MSIVVSVAQTGVAHTVDGKQSIWIPVSVDILLCIVSDLTTGSCIYDKQDCSQDSKSHYRSREHRPCRKTLNQWRYENRAHALAIQYQSLQNSTECKPRLDVTDLKSLIETLQDAELPK